MQFWAVAAEVAKLLSAAPSATIPRIRILLIPGPVGIQAQPAVEGNEYFVRTYWGCIQRGDQRGYQRPAGQAAHLILESNSWTRENRPSAFASAIPRLSATKCVCCRQRGDVTSSPSAPEIRPITSRQPSPSSVGCVFRPRIEGDGGARSDTMDRVDDCLKQHKTLWRQADTSTDYYTGIVR
jgi:hypothetical protein